jgi:hypothetical protein
VPACGNTQHCSMRSVYVMELQARSRQGSQTQYGTGTAWLLVHQADATGSTSHPSMLTWPALWREGPWPSGLRLVRHFFLSFLHCSRLQHTHPCHQQHAKVVQHSTELVPASEKHTPAIQIHRSSRYTEASRNSHQSACCGWLHTRYGELPQLRCPACNMAGPYVGAHTACS